MDGRFAGFRVSKQGDSDRACGLYCVLSAAQHVFRDDFAVHKAAVLRCIARSTALSKAMFGSGVLPAHFRALAEAARTYRMATEERWHRHAQRCE